MKKGRLITMKKTFKVLSVIVLIGAVVILSMSLHNIYQKLASAEADLKGGAFVEGQELGGVITANLNTWRYTEDVMLSDDQQDIESLSDIFTKIYEGGNVQGLSNDLVKITFSKKLTLTDASSGERVFYMVEIPNGFIFIYRPITDAVG